MRPTIGKVKAYILVRDKNNMPKVDNPKDVPDDVWNSFTIEEKQHVNSLVSDKCKREI